MGGTHNPQLLKKSESIWNYLLSHQITPQHYCRVPSKQIQLDSLGDKQLFFGKYENNDTSNILMAGTTWYTLLLIMPIQRPLFLRTLPKLLLNSQEENHSLVKTRSLMLAALKITGKP